jgi:hypothetical protein
MSTQRQDSVWVFHGEGARFASGVFTSKEKAAQWIEDRRLSGVLTAYPLDEGAYDWAIRNGFFIATNESTPRRSSFRDSLVQGRSIFIMSRAGRSERPDSMFHHLATHRNGAQKKKLNRLPPP